MAANNNNNNNNRKYNKKVKYNNKENILHIWLLFTVAGIIPLLVQLISGTSGLAVYDWYSSNDAEYDFFLHCKMIGIIILACVMLAVIVIVLYKKSGIYMPYFRDNRVIFVCAGIYVVMALLSAVFAEDVAAAFKGKYAQYEPFPVLAGYMVFLTFAYMFINSENGVRRFLKLFMWGVAGISFIGVLQFAAHDFFVSDFGKSVITMFSPINAESISLSFEPGRVYMTLYNPNYVGSYVALVLPVILAGIYVMQPVWQKIIMGIIAVMLVVCLIGSSSTTGMTAVVCAVLLAFVLSIPLFKKFKKYIGIIFGVALVSLIIIGVVNRGKINEAIAKYSLTDDTRTLNSIEISGDELKLEYKDTIMYVACNIPDGVQILIDVFDENHNKLEFTADQSSGMMIAADEFYRDICFSGASLGDGSLGFNVLCGNTYTFIKDMENGGFYYYNVYGKKTKDIVKSESIGFKGHEEFASNRGFIWSRSIPLLFDNIFAGCGPDNFIYEFPNNDYVAMANNAYSSQIVTRPHNMYLQIGVQTGVLSLIAVIVLYLMYFIQSVRLIWRSSTISVAYIMSLAILIGSFGYMICGIANDSTVCVAPVFWLMIGLGMACNRILKAKSV